MEIVAVIFDGISIEIWSVILIESSNADVQI